MKNRICETLGQPILHAKAHARIIEKLGPLPGESLRAMTGYGMNDREIARYYGLTKSTVKRLRRTLPVQGHWTAD